ncbi:AraC family transcriptional regulator [Flavobacterium agricola]|uniref:AraC family transcriptional regulator n=1 Tax=Flavobacterium agricola TaxID=2870839 RepID=A0ABY6M3V4_9FLAO|nr:helix-turn-helix transcriptional regulator [Flavobacterium agricola]UYW02565.1 AraC family transcriptional regulator [Flavobacterium agricola]
MKNIHVLNIAQFNNNNLVSDFYVNTLQNHLVNAHAHIDRPHKHDFYVTVIFTTGTGTHEIDFETFEVKPGSIFFLSPGQVHSWNLSDDVSGYIFFHTQTFFEQDFARNHIQSYPFFNYNTTHPYLYLENNKVSYFKNLFQHLLKEGVENNLLKSEKILILIQLIYIECARKYLADIHTETTTKHTYLRQFKDFQHWVEMHFKQEKSAAFYAEKLNVSSKHLNRICQNVIGKTTTDYILSRVLLEAKREIIYQKRSLAEIAYHLGYEDYAYFSRIFKKHFKETPSEFISKYR